MDHIVIDGKKVPFTRYPAGRAVGYPLQTAFMQELHSIPTYPTNSNKPMKVFKMSKEEFGEIISS